MSEETEILKFPRVINLDAILQPISEESPAGESTRYSGLYDEINEARRADDTMSQGDWQMDIKFADFKKVISLAEPALTTQTKDLQIAAYLTEALVKVHGFVGLRDSLKLMSGLQTVFWDTLFPEVEDGDMEGRANAVAFLDTQASFAIKEAAITQGEGYSFLGWEDSKKFSIPDGIDLMDTADQQRFLALKSQAEKEHRVTDELWKKAIVSSRRAFYEDLALIIAECWAEFNEINRVIEEKFDTKQMPGMSNLKKALELVETQVNVLLAQKREEEPDAIEEEPETDEVNGDGTTGSQSATGGTSGTIQGRTEALKRLAQLADFFKKTEPHSPISYLVTRAVKWGNMPLETWLQDVIKDDAVLFQLRQTLGLNTGTGEIESEVVPDSNAQENW
jgi:type VI secretion system protein ImpA